ncbi:globin [Macrococcus bovicus]|uniref:globin domain-containing protein n=1 Tax=Macrococcus bovicus TaxID=69968 RepID=UPI0025A65355|nr:globin [Macrococcus bovicus]WJP98428.1 globin [Macrococcus bovicus]
MVTPYEAIGQDTLEAIIDRFYSYVEADARINHLFSGDFAETARKQKQFLTQFLGGPSLYTAEHGHPMLRMRHLPFKITTFERDAWIDDMTRALHDFDMDSELRTFILERLKMTATHMVNSEE